MGWRSPHVEGRRSNLEPIEGDIEAQTERVLANLAAVLTAAGSGLEQVVRTTIYVTDLSLFARINTVYARSFDTDPAPARATVQVAALPLGAQIEIEAIAAIPPENTSSSA